MIISSHERPCKGTKKKEETKKKRNRFAISAFSFTFADRKQRKKERRYEMPGMQP